MSKLRATDGKVLGTFTVGSNPLGIAFDGANMWIANRSSGTVSKLRASDGATLGTFTIGGGPYGVALDGTNIWVGGDPGVDELRTSDGAILAVYNLGGNAITGLAFDGASIWFSDLSTNKLYKF